MTNANLSPNASQVLTVIRASYRATGSDRLELAALRPQIWLDAHEVDAALIELQDRDLVVLYRNDRTASLTEADHAAALHVGGCPRHLVYLLNPPAPTPVTETDSDPETTEQIASETAVEIASPVAPPSAPQNAVSNPATIARPVSPKAVPSPRPSPAIGYSAPVAPPRPQPAPAHACPGAPARTHACPPAYVPARTHESAPTRAPACVRRKNP